MYVIFSKNFSRHGSKKECDTPSPPLLVIQKPKIKAQVLWYHTHYTRRLLC